MTQNDVARLQQLAKLLEDEALTRLNSDSMTYWYEGKRYVDRDRAKVTLDKLDLADRLRSRANSSKTSGRG